MRKRALIICVFISIAALVITGTTLVAINSSKTNQLLSTKVLVQPSDNVTSVAGLWKPYDLTALAGASDAIVIGKVVNILPSQWGLDYKQSNKIIHTDVKVEVKNWLYGQQSLNLIAIRTYGGRVENDVRIVMEDPVYIIGEETLLFLRKLEVSSEDVPTDIDSQAVYLVIGGPQGKYEYQNGAVIDWNGNHVSIADIEQQIASTHIDK
jgi:hypothetical protein